MNGNNSSRNEHGKDCWEMCQELRRRCPLVHCITNYVSMDLMANTLLAVGASPAMVHDENEVVEFTTISQALLINIGTLSPRWVSAMKLAAKASKLWVLDPVGCGATSLRTQTCKELLDLHPTVIRGNPSEIIALANACGIKDSDSNAQIKGVDSVVGSEAASSVSAALALHANCVVAVTGEVDIITDGYVSASVHNGHELMQKVTATGCSLSAVVAAFVACAPSNRSKDIVMATAYAIAVFGLTGEKAFTRLKEKVDYDPLSLTSCQAGVGPGSLRVMMLDLLYTLRKEDVINCFTGVHISVKENLEGYV